MEQLKLIFGTCKISEKAIKQSLGAGYCALDTATGYNNATAIGKILADQKERPLIITKFNPTDFKDIDTAVKLHLAELGVTPDFVIIHTPLETNDANVVAFKKIRSLIPNKKYGISNFSISQIQYLIDNDCKPEMVSLEFSPFYQPNKLISFCKKNNIPITGYRPTYKGKIFSDSTIKQISQKHKASVGQVVLKWIADKNIIPIVASNKIENMIDNFDFDKLTLDEDDIRQLNGLNTNMATCMTKFCSHD